MATWPLSYGWSIPGPWRKYPSAICFIQPQGALLHHGHLIRDQTDGGFSYFIEAYSTFKKFLRVGMAWGQKLCLSGDREVMPAVKNTFLRMAGNIKAAWMRLIKHGNAQTSWCEGMDWTKMISKSNLFEKGYCRWKNRSPQTKAVNKQNIFLEKGKRRGTILKFSMFGKT